MSEQPEKEYKASDIPRTVWGFTGFVFKEIVHQRKWILFPVWVLLAAAALVVLVGGGTSLLPAIYIAF